MTPRPRVILATVAVLGGVVLLVPLLLWIAGGTASAIPSGCDPRTVRIVAATVAPRRPWLGLLLQPTTDVMRERLGLPEEGVVVSDVLPGSPGAAVGLRPGDVVQEVFGHSVDTPADVQRLCRELVVGGSVPLVVWRGGTSAALQLTAAERPAASEAPPSPLPEAEIEVEAAWLGLDIVPLTPAEAEELGIAGTVRGMLVDDVAAGRGVDAGLATGDVILAVNQQPTRTLDELKVATKDAVGAVVEILRRGRHLFVSVPPPGTSKAERRAARRRLGVRQVGFETLRSPEWRAPSLRDPPDAGRLWRALPLPSWGEGRGGEGWPPAPAPWSRDNLIDNRGDLLESWPLGAL